MPQSELDAALTAISPLRNQACPCGVAAWMGVTISNHDWSPRWTGAIAVTGYHGPIVLIGVSGARLS